MSGFSKGFKKARGRFKTERAARPSGEMEISKPGRAVMREPLFSGMRSQWGNVGPEERRKKLGRERNTIMQDRLGG